MAHSLEIDYYNTLVLKRYMDNLHSSNSGFTAKGALNPSYFNNSHYSLDLANSTNTYIEEGRIKGGFNKPFMDKGPKAYADDDNKRESTKVLSGLIYSGPLNSSTGLNETNFFSVADTITRQADPINGSIQLLYSEDTNLIVLQELKASRAMIDKDIIYTSEGTGLTTAGAKVIGQINAYAGEYGISKNPESFAVYGYQKYFVDKNRGSVIRLSGNGTTPISDYGMKDFFRDELSVISDDFKQENLYISTADCITSVHTYGFTISNYASNVPNGVIQPGDKLVLKNISSSDEETTTVSVISAEVKNTNLVVIVDSSLIVEDFINLGDSFANLLAGSGRTYYLGFTKKYQQKIVGGYDEYNKMYILSVQNKDASIGGKAGNTTDTTTYKTLSFDEGTNSWVSFLSFHTDHLFSYNNKFFSTHPSGIYKHYVDSVSNNYCKFYGRVTLPYVELVFNQNASLSKVFKTVEYEGSSGWRVSSITSDKEGPVRNLNSSTSTSSKANTYLSTFSEDQDQATIVRSYLEGRYELNTPGNHGLNAVTPPYEYTGFRRYENKYYANLINTSTQREGEVAFGNQISGIKGHFISVKITTDTITEPNNRKELFSVSTNVI